MKANLSRIIAIAAIGLIALCASPTPASAQDAFKGSFTLASDVRWSNALLPAGEYTFALKSTAAPAQILLHGPNGYAFILTSVKSDGAGERGSSLTIERRSGTRYVTELHLAELGMNFIYSAPKLPDNEIAQGPATTERVLVAMTTN